MPERIEWLDDGTAGGSPFSPRFGDRYRSELGGLDQAKEVFLKGCGLPEAWAGQPQWTVLETGFGLGLNFLVTWAAWKADPQRPGRLHFVSTEAFPASAADVLRSAQTHPELIPFAEQLQAQLWGQLPGFHRLVFEGGRVLLTLCIGDAKAMLREQSFEADSVYLDGFSPQRNPDIWDLHTFKAVARCCRRGTRIATWTIARSVRDALAQSGFVVKKVPGIPPKRDNLQGDFNPAWEPKRTQPPQNGARPRPAW
jgi:tRNA 5-methylaminomethyl-2-thiouridine biosynthesis bifunctional protein